MHYVKLYTNMHWLYICDMCVGTKSEMSQLEKQFFEGLYTPFEEGTHGTAQLQGSECTRVTRENLV